jgi:hypothetical protein
MSDYVTDRQKPRGRSNSSQVSIARHLVERHSHDPTHDDEDERNMADRQGRSPSKEVFQRLNVSGLATLEASGTGGIRHTA